VRDGARARRVPVALAVAAVWVLAAAGTPLAQVSPGPLSRAHAALEGNLACVKCHGKAKGDMDRKCLA
jgi:hypothetical protein